MNSSQAERLRWIVLTVVGLVGGLALALPLGVPIFAIVGAMAGTPIVLGIVGLSLGTAQWSVIRGHMSPSWWWILVSTLGLAVGLTAGVILVEHVGRYLLGAPVNFRMLGVAARAVSFATIGVISGATLGLAQWFVLRRHAHSCTVWIRVNSWSLGAGLLCGSLLADLLVMKSGSLASAGVLLVIGSAVAGACTAKALGKIFTPSAQPTSATGQ